MLMLEVRRVVVLAVVLMLTLGAFPRQIAFASSGCSAAVTPTSVPPGSEASLQFDVNNTGSDPVVWIQIQRPTVSYAVNGITQSGWTDATDENGTTLTSGSLGPGGSFSLQLALFTGPQEESASTWTVQVSTSSDGSGAISCTGGLDTSIANPVTPPQPNGESNIGLTNVTATTATIGWNSDTSSSSYVYYGPDTSYGKTATVPGSTSVHSVVLSGLSPSTIYHYEVAGSDDQGNNLFSGDNTFITPAAPPPIPPPIIITTPTVTTPSGTIVAPKIIPAVAGDTTPPSVSLDTVLNHPFLTSPTLQGHATDNGALAHIQYSIDGGRNWLPVAHITGLGTGSAAFSFTPVIQDDGNYPIEVDAIDSNGNEAHTSASTLVIDRLPPQLGPLVVSYGPQVLSPNPQGVMELLAGNSYHLSASAIGGATNIVIEARPEEQLNLGPTSFSLTQSSTSGLWSGLLSFKTGGIYELVAKSLDGAGNRTTRTIMTVAVTPAGKILDATTNQPIKQASLSLYYFEPSSSTWQIWDGAPYAQTNPQKTRVPGTYSLVVPAGKYYLSVSAPHYRTYTSSSFETTSPLSVASTIALEPAPYLTVGSLKLYLPTINLITGALPKPLQGPIADTKSLAGTQIPSFSLPTIAGGTIRNIDLEGKPTDLVILTTWSPSGQSQLPSLADAQSNKDVNITPVFSGEHPNLVSTYLATAGYSLSGLVDPDGILVLPLQIGSLPEHILVDRSGRIKKVMVGILSKDQILASLGGL